MISAAEARSLKTRSVTPVVQVLDKVGAAIERVATQGRVTEIDISPLVPQPHSMVWMAGGSDAFIQEIKAALLDHGFEVKTRNVSPAQPGYIKVCW